jgi:hypothetical protein
LTAGGSGIVGSLGESLIGSFFIIAVCNTVNTHHNVNYRHAASDLHNNKWMPITGIRCTIEFLGVVIVAFVFVAAMAKVCIFYCRAAIFIVIL